MTVKTETISKSVKSLEVKSEAFANGGLLLSKFTCDGENVNPPLSILNIPKETKSMVIIVQDCDTVPGCWLHWIVWNIMPTQKIKENSRPGIEGKNDFGRFGYGGPCPSSGLHRYVFKVYALDCLFDLKPNASRKIVENRMTPHIIGFGELVGFYERKI